MTARRTVDITVDAYDAPGLIAVARERERQRDLGHDDAMGMPLMRELNPYYCGSALGIDHTARFRCANDDRGVISCVSVMLEEVREAVDELTELELIGEAERRRKSEAAEVELTQAAAVMLRIASKLRAERLGNIDAKGGE
jgi:hypothetical protein